MTIFELIGQEARGKGSGHLLTAALGGIFNVVALMFVNSAAHAPQTASLASFLAFAAAAGASIATTRMSSHRMVAMIETGLQRIISRIVSKIERSELQRIERIGAAEILVQVTKNVEFVANQSSFMSTIVPSLSIFVCGCLYLLLLSPVAFACVLLPLLVSVYLYHKRNVVAGRLLAEEGKARVQLLGMLMDLLRGAKEIRLGRARTQDALRDFKNLSTVLGQKNAKINQLFDDNSFFVTANLYALLAALVFVLPSHVPINAAQLSKLITSILFVWGSVRNGLGVYSYYIQVNDALANIAALEIQLDGPQKKPGDSAVQRPSPWRGNPGPIQFVNVHYTYPAENGDTQFELGPVNVTIEPGEVLFIVGGNGSGKSSLLRVLTGLYAPTSGTLLAGDVVVESRNADDYREMISIIFADFHLFSKVYGLLDIDPDAVRTLLAQMQIEHKTSFEAGAFTQQRLSTGQKKRLAMVIALLEDRPLLVLDEWAADQDPEFRKYFYETVIPTLKRKGKTIVAVSHDDRYFHIADRVLTMERGQVRSIVCNTASAVTSAHCDT